MLNLKEIDNSLRQSITEIQKRKLTSQSELDSLLESSVDYIELQITLFHSANEYVPVHFRNSAFFFRNKRLLPETFKSSKLIVSTRQISVLVFFTVYMF